MDSLLYMPGRGLFYRLDPRARLVFALSVSIYLLIEQSPAALLLALLGLHTLALLAASTRARLGPLWKMLAPLLITLLVLGSLRWPAIDALLAVGPLGVTMASIWQTVGLAARIAALTLAFSLVLWTTEPGDAVVALTRLGIPFALSFPAVMAVQQIIAFKAMFAQILEAQQSRGLVIGRRNPVQAARAYIPVIVPLLINALRQADDLALALQMRGFGARAKRSSRRQLRWTIWDWLFVGATWAALFLLTRLPYG
ncbi:MAG: energy-coupling factor transporter transmembrane protein EcfT [Anaerolineae bacterium]|nr:energy-coupling factor transporter transmembrane protein EcfT [Anaerolineae bacterium]